MTLNQYQEKPIYDSNGRPWVQQCYICAKGVDFRKDPFGRKWVRNAHLVRHKRCNPGVTK